MRGRCLLCLALCAACTTKETPSSLGPDAVTGNRPAPRVIAGGGIGDGAIDGVANLYVIDDRTRMPVVNASVRIGATEGVTDATGLFVAHGAVGPQTVVMKATGYRSEVWIGANGANLTLNVQPSIAPVAPRAELSGQITGFAGILVPAGHAKVAIVTYSQADDLGDPANALETAGDANTCVVTTAIGPCRFKLTTRTGRIGLIAAIFDRDLKGTVDPNDDSSTLIRWAVHPGITVSDGGDLTGQDLSLIPATATSSATIDFGAPPSTLPVVAGLIGIDTVDDGVYQLPVFRTPADPSLLVPTLTAINATGYRVTGIAASASGASATQSIVVRRALTGATLPTGTWLPPPASVAITRTGASWSAPAGAAVTSVEYSQGSSTVTRLLTVTVWDAATRMTIPSLVALPTTGAIDARLSVLSATGLDVTSFSLDAERNKLDRVSAQPVALPGA
jgi:hypothetical protein